MGYRFDKEKHAHFLDESPLIGTTTALSVISKELTWWASGMACMKFGWLNPKKASKAECLAKATEGLALVKKMDPAEYLVYINEAYRNFNTSKDEAKDKGVDLHAMIEEYIKSKMARRVIPDLNERIVPFVKWANENVKEFLFSELHCYSKSLHCGGIADFGFIDKDGKIVLGDIKSSKEAYFSQWVQLGGYQIQLQENGGFDAEGKQTFPIPDKPFEYYAIFAAGAGLDKPFFCKETDRMQKAFCFALNLYREKMFFESN